MAGKIINVSPASQYVGYIASEVSSEKTEDEITVLFSFYVYGAPT